MSLRLLPAETREAVALAYLLARAADTVADTRLVPRAERLRALEALAGAFAGAGAGLEELARDLAALTRQDDVLPEEQALLAALPGCLALLARLPAAEQALVREVLATIVAGQRWDLERFPGSDAAGLVALEAPAELEGYCFHVAGCVGAFWSDLHRLRVPGLARRLAARAGPGPAGAVADDGWRADGVRLGHALQLTNVLRDVPRDLRHGRCYLPAADLAAAGLAPGDLLDPGVWPRARPVWEAWAARAVAHAEAGLRHVLGVPGRHVRLRLAEALPLLLALRTLGVTRAGNPLDPAARRKVPRRVVWTTLWAALRAARSDRDLAALHRRTLALAGLADLARRAPAVGA